MEPKPGVVSSGYMYTVTSTASGQQNAQSQAMITAIKVGKAATYC